MARYYSVSSAKILAQTISFCQGPPTYFGKENKMTTISYKFIAFFSQNGCFCLCIYFPSVLNMIQTYVNS